MSLQEAAYSASLSWQTLQRTTTLQIVFRLARVCGLETVVEGKRKGVIISSRAAFGRVFFLLFRELHYKAPHSHPKRNKRVSCSQSMSGTSWMFVITNAFFFLNVKHLHSSTISLQANSGLGIYQSIAAICFILVVFWRVDASTSVNYAHLSPADTHRDRLPRWIFTHISAFWCN